LFFFGNPSIIQNVKKINTVSIKQYKSVYDIQNRLNNFVTFLLRLYDIWIAMKRRALTKYRNCGGLERRKEL